MSFFLQCIPSNRALMLLQILVQLLNTCSAFLCTWNVHRFSFSLRKNKNFKWKCEMLRRKVKSLAFNTLCPDFEVWAGISQEDWGKRSRNTAWEFYLQQICQPASWDLDLNISFPYTASSFLTGRFWYNVPAPRHRRLTNAFHGAVVADEGHVKRLMQEGLLGPQAAYRDNRESQGAWEPNWRCFLLCTTSSLGQRTGKGPGTDLKAERFLTASR